MDRLSHPLTALALAGLCAMPLAARAALITLNPGLPLTSLGAGTTLADDPSLAGLVLADVVDSFVGPGFGGTFQTRVVRRDDSGTLDFYYRINAFNDNSTARALRDFRIGDFAGWNTAVTYRPDGLGTEAPQQAVRFPTPPCPACNGINFIFADLSAGGPPTFTSGDESLFMAIRTDAYAYTTTTADVYLTTLPGATFDQFLSTPFTVFAPAVPEPQTYLMMLAGLAGLGAWMRRRR